MIVHVPLSPEHLDGTREHWQPWLERIAKDIGCHVHDLIGQAYIGDIKLHVAWDDEANKSLALLGARILKRGDASIAELAWCTGESLDLWSGLLPDIEAFYRNHWGCKNLTAHCRPGWKPFLKRHAYRMTHVIMDKEL